MNDTVKTWDQIKQEWLDNRSHWIKSSEGINKNVIEWAEDFGKELAGNSNNNKKVIGKLTTSQLRKFFGQLKRIQAAGFDKINKSELYMLKAQLAYAKGRDKGKTKIIYFAEILSSAIDYIEDKEHFKNFVNIVEAIVAFHKANGGE